MPKRKRQNQDPNNSFKKVEIKTTATTTTSQTKQNDLKENHKTVEKTVLGKDVLPHESLVSYQDCVKLIQPLKDYINRIGNQQALLRLREVDKVLKYQIKNDKRPKKSC